MKFIVTVFEQDHVENIANYFKGEIVSHKEGLIIVSAKSMYELDQEIKEKFPKTDFDSVAYKS